jgi:outer membrane biosynthesis protein TonB
LKNTIQEKKRKEKKRKEKKRKEKKRKEKKIRKGKKGKKGENILNDVDVGQKSHSTAGAGYVQFIQYNALGRLLAVCLSHVRGCICGTVAQFAQANSFQVVSVLVGNHFSACMASNGNDHFNL